MNAPTTKKALLTAQAVGRVGFLCALLASASAFASKPDTEPFLLGPVGIQPVEPVLTQTDTQRARLMRSIDANQRRQTIIESAAATRNLQPEPKFELAPTRKQKLERMHAMAEATPPAEQWIKLVTQNREVAPAKALDRWNAVGTQISNVDGSTRAMGAVSDIEFAYDPFDARTTLYLGTIAGGLWKQRLLAFFPFNAPISENLLGSPSVGAFHVGETATAFILLGTGANGRAGGTGLYRSSNNGGSWIPTVMDGINPGAFFKIDRSVSSASKIYACTSSGFFSSADSGQTWTRKRPVGCTDFYEFGGAQGGILMVADYSGTAPYLHYVIVPTSGAWTWTAADDSGITGSVGRLSIAMGNPSSDHAYAFVADANNNGNGVFRSSTYGLSGWQKISSGAQFFGNTMGFYANEIRVSPTDDNVVAAGLVNLFVSTNATNTTPVWEQVVSQLYDHTDVEFVPQSVSPGNTRFVFSNDGGVFTYDWVSKVVGTAENNRGMNVQLVMGSNNSMSQSHANRNLIGAGLWDAGSMLVDLAASASTRIRYLTGADGGAFGMSSDNAAHMIGTFGAPWSRLRSTDQGANFTQFDNGCSNVEAPMTYPWSLTLEPTPGYSNRAYTFARTGSGASLSYKIFRQSLAAANCSWTALHATNLPALFSQTNLGDVFVQVANNTSADIVYLSASKTDKVWTLTGSAPTMTVTEHTPSFTPVIDPIDNNGDTAYFSADRNPGRPNTAYQVVFKESTGQISLALTDTAGVQWENVSGNINSLAQGSLPFELIGNSNDLNQLFVATAIGVFRSDNRGQTWSTYSQGLPASIYVVNLEFDASVSPPRLLLGSYGRGFYSREVSPRVLPVDVFKNGFE